MADTSAGFPHAVPLTGVRPGRWTLDPARSTASLRHKTMFGLHTVKGAFTKLSGEGESLPGGAALGTLIIDAASIDTRHKTRDLHLRSADFLDVDNHPSIAYTATEVTPGRDGTVQVKGTLTVLGQTRPLNFATQTSEVTEDAVTLTVGISIDRKDFAITWKNRLGMFLMKDIAFIALTVRFTRSAS